jgi:hypothetical protein
MRSRESDAGSVSLHGNQAEEMEDADWGLFTWWVSLVAEAKTDVARAKLNRLFG